MPVQPSSNGYIAWFETLGKADVAWRVRTILRARLLARSRIPVLVYR